MDRRAWWRGCLRTELDGEDRYLYIATDVKFSGPLGIGGTMSQTAKVSDNLFRVGINFKYP